MKKMKKISALVTALAMSATMAAGMALNAGAYCIHDGDDCVEDVTFYTYYSSTSSWAPAPHGMDTVNIADATDNGDGTYTLTLRTGTLTFGTYYQVEGTITSVSTTEGGTNLISGDSVTLSTGSTYYILVAVDNAAHTSTWYPVQLHVEECDCSSCSCNDYLND